MLLSNSDSEILSEIISNFWCLGPKIIICWNLAFRVESHALRFTLALRLSVFLYFSRCSVWSLPPVWQHSPGRLSAECDDDCWEPRLSVLHAFHRASTRWNNVVQPTRSIGV